MTKRNILKFLISCVCVLVIAFSIATIAKAASYSVLIEDDYWHGYDVGAFHVNFWDYIAASLNYSKHMYLDWQGTYFSMFLQALLSPVNNYGMTQLRIVMVFNAVNLFVSLIGFVWVMLSNLVKKERIIKLVICACIVFSVTSYKAFEEIFYWFSGAASYSFPLSLLFYSLIAVNLCHSTQNKKAKYIYWSLAIILGTFAMGGSLIIAATGCCLMLLACVYELLVSKKVTWMKWSVFAVYVLGALVNTVAPGNFIRQKTSDGEGLHILASIKNSLLLYESHFHWIFSKTNFSIILLIIIICGMILYGKMEIKYIEYTLVSLGAVFIPLVGIFPVVLGYNVPWMPNRCEFVVVTLIVLIFVNLAFVAGWWMIKIVSESNRKLMVVISVLLIFVTSSVNNYSIHDYTTIRICEELVDGTIPDYYGKYVNMLQRFKDAEEVDLRLDQSEIPEAIDNFYCFDLSDNPDNRTNQAIAYIYGLNSIAKNIQ